MTKHRDAFVFMLLAHTLDSNRNCPHWLPSPQPVQEHAQSSHPDSVGPGWKQVDASWTSESVSPFKTFNPKYRSGNRFKKQVSDTNGARGRVDRTQGHFLAQPALCHVTHARTALPVPLGPRPSRGQAGRPEQLLWLQVCWFSPGSTVRPPVPSLVAVNDKTMVYTPVCLPFSLKADALAPRLRSVPGIWAWASQPV